MSLSTLNQLIKVIVHVDITTIPVPYHMNEELIDGTESKYTYTKIKPTTEVLALGRSCQINLGYHDLYIIFI